MTASNSNNPVNDHDDDESAPLRNLLTIVGGNCADCRKPYSAREGVLSIFLGMKNAPRCMPCTSRRLERPGEELWSDFRTHIRDRQCYLKAWREAEKLDGVQSSELPDDTNSSSRNDNPTDPEVDLRVDLEWDGGDMGCGELVMALRIRMMNLAAGNIVQVRATDPAAPEDLPAWCRLCGHTLVAMNHPHYWIRRKGD